MHAVNHLRAWRPLLVGCLAILFLGGCSSGTNTTSSFIPVDGGGTHPADFLSTHPTFAVSDVSPCKTCHGEALTGGIARVSCFQNAANCHHGTVSAWVLPAAHGAQAKKAPVSSGFFSCRICHASDFSGDGAKAACLNAACHGGVGRSPHPANWRSGDAFVHITTDQGNAPVCVSCHLAGANSPIPPPSPPAPGGTPPGCFNNTLCHGAGGAPHPVGLSWVTTPPAAQPHGGGAKSTGSTSGFAYCRICHGTGTNFAGGSSGISCYPCHGASSPHPSLWRTGDTYVHVTTAEGNASACAFCHAEGVNSPIPPPSPPAPGGTPPGCFNNTLCHGAGGTPHLLGATWRDPTGTAFHGLEAKKNLAFCQTCHGTPGTPLFDGGAAPTKCSTCHPAAGAHPTTWYQPPAVSFPGYIPSHRNALNKDTTCNICHDYTQGRTPPVPAAPSCFSGVYANGEHASVGCHAGGPGAPNHLVPFLDPDHLGAKQSDFDGDCSNCHAVSGNSPVSSAPACQVCHTAGSPLSPTGSFGVCTSCHGYPPDGASGTYPNVAGAHAVHIGLDGLGAGTPVDCDTCHFKLGFVTRAHYDRANGRPGMGGRVPPGDLAFDNSYNARSGVSSFDNTLSVLSCSNVSCHGGKITPNWQTGAIDLNTQCASCHQLGTGPGIPQHNAYWSGEHDREDHATAGCTACHNTATLAAGHFTALGTPAMEGPASATIGGGTTRVTGYSGGTCTNTCHDPERWQGD